MHSLLSCSHTNVERYADGTVHKKYEVNKSGKVSGMYKEFHPDGSIKEISLYQNGIRVDSSAYYVNGVLEKVVHHLPNDTTLVREYQDGKLRSQGKRYKEGKIGQWVYLDRGRSTIKMFEYINLCGNQYTNQGWHYDSTGKLIFSKSNFYEVIGLPEAISRGEVLSFQVNYQPVLSGSKSFLCLSSEITKEYCNVERMKLDTVWSQDHSFDMKMRFAKPGAKLIRGFITEFTEQPTKNDSSRYNTRKVYVTLNLFVN